MNFENFFKNLQEKKYYKRYYFDTQTKYSEMNNEFCMKTFERKMDNLKKTLAFMYDIYQEDLNYDLLMNYIDTLAMIKVTNLPFVKVAEWIRGNISQNSMFNMIHMEFTRAKENDFTEYSRISSEFNDIMKMISDIVKNDKEPELVRPLRFEEFHNKLVRVHLKATIKNKDYKKTFLQIPLQKDSYEVLEPSNSYELAEWATTVKNCVFSYESHILSGDSTIFLIKKDGRPSYTVEVKNKSKNISQVEKIYKSSMTQKELSEVEFLVRSIISENENS